jgi:PPM family protein phosphatase
MDSRLHLLCASQSEMGRRDSNDDAVLIDQAAGLYMVCDGARGRFGGRTAGELAVDTMQRFLPDVVRGIGDSLSPASERLAEQLMLQAHRTILSAQASDPALEGMTTTCAMVLQRGAQVMVSHVGDTRVYLLRDGQLQQLTVDHNLENYLKENPGFKPKVKLSGKTLVRALGLKTSALKVDHRHLMLQKDDLILINTDGLTDSLPTLTLQCILETGRLRSADEVTQALVRAALSHGTTDNVSLILLQVSDKIVEGPKTTIFEMDSVVQSKQLVMGWLVFLDPPHHGRVVPLEASTVLGADPDCKIQVPEDYVSGRHAEVVRTEHGFTLRDLGSTNGTYINNARAQTQEECLVDGDRIRVGRTEMVFKSHSLER